MLDALLCVSHPKPGNDGAGCEVAEGSRLRIRVSEANVPFKSPGLRSDPAQTLKGVLDPQVPARRPQGGCKGLKCV